MAWEEFERLVARGAVAEVVKRCAALSEGERRALSKPAAAAARAVFEDALSPSFGGASWRARAEAAELVAFGTGGPAAVAAGRVSWLPHEHLERLALSRPREWRDDWAARVLERAGEGWEMLWPLVHRLVVAGECAKPPGDRYVLGALNGLRTEGRSLTDVLRDDPFLEEDFWRLFEIEGRGEPNPTTCDEGWPRGSVTWTEAVVALSGEGVLDRERLLDESLATLRRDFNPYCARWFHKLHEALAPTVDERAARQPVYLALLSSGDTAVVSFALGALRVLERAGRLDEAALFEHLGAAVVARTKGAALKAVRMGARALDRRPDLARVALPVLAEALAHESRDVQEAAVDVLERHEAALDEAPRRRLRDFVPSTDPALRDRVAALAGDAAAAADVASSSPPPAAVVEPGGPRLVEPLRPVEDVDDLADRLAVLLERADDPDELELVLDGASRLCDRRPDDGRAAALRARVEAHMGEWRSAIGLAPQTFAALLADAWLNEPSGRDLLRDGWGVTSAALSRRLHAVLADIRARRPRARLATATHRGGWIDPVVAAARVAALDERPEALDLAQAVLRLAPERREEALRAAEPLKGEAAAVLRRALGGDGRKPLLGRLGVAWEAADQARDPASAPVPEVELRRGPEAAWRQYFSVPARKPRIPNASPATVLVSDNHQWMPGGLERWIATVFPAAREAYFALAVNRLAGIGDTAMEGTEDIFLPLLDPREPVGPMARLVLALGLRSAQPEVRASAADAILEAFGTRRLDGDGLGGALAQVLREHAEPLPNRWADPLAGVAAVHPGPVQRTLERVLAAADDDQRRGLIGLIELLRRLAMEGGGPVADPAARAFLERIPPRSKSGRAARDALAVGA